MDIAMTSSVRKINALARQLHGSDTAATVFTLNSLRALVDEVEALLKAGDAHWKAETVDIVIHALTLLQRDGVGQRQLDGLMSRRLARFEARILAANGNNKDGE